MNLKLDELKPSVQEFIASVPENTIRKNNKMACQKQDGRIWVAEIDTNGRTGNWIEIDED